LKGTETNLQSKFLLDSAIKSFNRQQTPAPEQKRCQIWKGPISNWREGGGATATAPPATPGLARLAWEWRMSVRTSTAEEHRHSHPSLSLCHDDCSGLSGFRNFCCLNAFHEIKRVTQVSHSQCIRRTRALSRQFNLFCLSSHPSLIELLARPKRGQWMSISWYTIYPAAWPDGCPRIFLGFS
jgi:hypothetical protein